MNWAFQKDQREDTSSHFHIFVGDLASEFNDAALFEAFKQCPGCSEARVMWDHTTNRSKGYGFVAFRWVPVRLTLNIVVDMEYAASMHAFWTLHLCSTRGTTAYAKNHSFAACSCSCLACQVLGSACISQVGGGSRVLSTP